MSIGKTLINLEVAHIYWGKNLRNAREELTYHAKEAARFIEAIPLEQSINMCVSVLLDDKSNKQGAVTWKWEDYAREMVALYPDVEVDFIVLESELSVYRDFWLDGQMNAADLSLRNTPQDQCMQYAAIWHMLRLEVLKSDHKVVYPVSKRARWGEVKFQADYAVSLLPESYISLERNIDKKILRKRLDYQSWKHRLHRYYYPNYSEGGELMSKTLAWENLPLDFKKI